MDADETRRAAGRSLAAERKARGLTQEGLATELGLAGKSYVSGIETADMEAGLETALRIQAWSEGRVAAKSLRPDKAHLLAEFVRTAADPQPELAA